ncbi:cobaltochelatase subunit CobN [Rhodoblastus acidophilus]|uniref:Cobaltochelatase subunit CobN n=1 Tax=Candidatus Rhodoblastus alkanivorans TaxID=2954117 RepID=A0ABS9Z922_9HYPH|nr:cobaltochelatase subunit CobN [Candidatus Rhodoblastus alkanivorans]MCI4679286.1 cobaltochelatase subunit CobN [Candidatus Rhodoblastus alkanivorans]MCI4684087.1 cobaltochelatase subunit CobN [Candidatus Rhodoblastus alkanivorans]MDI4641407.1 cobaltochelatase subunit CobN [Rhodoblastus acidophilus]
MHLVRTDQRSFDEAAQAVDLEQSPADIVVLSFADSDLSLLAGAHAARHPSLRLAPLALLKHPFSVDLYIEKVCAMARFVLVRLLGGLDYWRYGVEELAAAARKHGFALAIVPGDAMEDARLDAASTLPPQQLRQIWDYFRQGGPDNIAACLDFIATKISGEGDARPPHPVAPFGAFAPGCLEAPEAAPTAFVLFYRSAFLAGDDAPIRALAEALARENFLVRSSFISSLKDPAACALLAERIVQERPDVILNATAFSARLDAGAVLDGADAPVLQVILSGAQEAQWRESRRGLSAADLAMNVVLPEVDGRIVTRAISFKREAERRDALEYAPARHEPEPSRVAFVAALAARWARLRRLANAEKKLALILSDYPAKGGRAGYAVGLDTEQSARAIIARLIAEGYDAQRAHEKFLEALQSAPLVGAVSLRAYRAFLKNLPQDFVAALDACWGAPENDLAVRDGAFAFRFLRLGKIIVALQPDRGAPENRKADYHDATLPPRHAFLAFYLWLREREKIDALVHCGAHGALEWLPGKSVALAQDCAPEIALGPLPLIYPFIVNNPGEAAQAKRRSAAVIVSHLSPPLVKAGAHGALAEIENLFDEYAQAQGLDPRRANLLADLILQRAESAGLLRECGAGGGEDALIRLDAWLCDLKEMRINDGLHVFGRSPQGALRDEMLACCAASDFAQKIDDCGAAEMDALVHALNGGFVAPSPAGAPGRGRMDVLPTGRNLFSVDPRAVPTRTAWDIGRKLAQDVIERYLQDHGDWPRRMVLDLWGSASMRTGGDDLAQAFALLGVRPVWDAASTRMSGFEILPLAQLGRPRVDVTLRISGLFRDVFPQQIEAFDAAVRALAQLDEPAEENPLAGARDPSRIFGAAPGAYGVDLSSAFASAQWQDRADLARKYLAANAQSYGRDGAPQGQGDFAERIRAADAFVHVQDLAGQDILNADAFSTHEGGFAAAAELLGAAPRLYHVDATDPEAAKVRSLDEEIARVVHGRATNPRWIDGMMRHGANGAAEIAETVDNFFAFAALADVVQERQFDLLFDAFCGDDKVRAFLETANPRAAKSIAEKFGEAERRGLWTSRRNSTAAILAEMRNA